MINEAKEKIKLCTHYDSRIVLKWFFFEVDHFYCFQKYIGNSICVVLIRKKSKLILRISDHIIFEDGSAITLSSKETQINESEYQELKDLMIKNTKKWR